ncbi:MAG TPA: hypothetical protein DEP77_06285 [Bacteroidales bacterium]|nr:hypothetical protein [Bacteroidales bacterium]
MKDLLEAVSKFILQSKNNIPPSDATKELKDMEPLFLLLLRRFHVPAEQHLLKSSKPFDGFLTGRNGGMS